MRVLSVSLVLRKLKHEITNCFNMPVPPLQLLQTNWGLNLNKITTWPINSRPFRIWREKLTYSIYMYFTKDKHSSSISSLVKKVKAFYQIVRNGTALNIYRYSVNSNACMLSPWTQLDTPIRYNWRVEFHSLLLKEPNLFKPTDTHSSQHPDS